MKFWDWIIFIAVVLSIGLWVIPAPTESPPIHGSAIYAAKPSPSPSPRVVVQYPAPCHPSTVTFDEKRNRAVWACANGDMFEGSL